MDYQQAQDIQLVLVWCGYNVVDTGAALGQLWIESHVWYVSKVANVTVHKHCINFQVALMTQLFLVGVDKYAAPSLPRLRTYSWL